MTLRARLPELWRYYKIGVINTLFGYGLYVLMVTAGLNLYAAQIIAHVIGMGFNYLMFTRHVFHGKRASKRSYVAAYAANYGVSLALLAGFHRLVASPALAGLLATIAASAVNYVVLKRFVFTTDRGVA